MSIAEAIEALLKVPESKRHLPLYVCDFCENSECLHYHDNLPVQSISPYDEGAPHDDENMLAMNYCPNPQSCSGY